MRALSKSEYDWHTPVIEQLREQMCNAVVSKKDGLIEEAVRRYLGVEHVDKSLLLGRLTCVTQVGKAGETYCVDNVPVLWVGELRFPAHDGHITVAFSHRMIGEAAHVHPKQR